MCKSLLCEESLIISGTYKRLLLSTGLSWYVLRPHHLMLMSIGKARSGIGSCLAVHLRGLRGNLLLLIAGILMLSLLFTIISSTLFEIIHLFFKNITNFL
jgi:hypothetical protein